MLPEPASGIGARTRLALTGGRGALLEGAQTHVQVLDQLVDPALDAALAELQLLDPAGEAAQLLLELAEPHLELRALAGRRLGQLDPPQLGELGPQAGEIARHGREIGAGLRRRREQPSASTSATQAVPAPARRALRDATNHQFTVLTTLTARRLLAQAASSLPASAGRSSP